MKKMTEIYIMTMHDDHNFLVFDDSDSTVDYFHAISLSTSNTIDFLKRQGAQKIIVDIENTANNYATDELIKFEKRAKKIAKEAGYKIQKNIKIVYDHDYIANPDPEYINIFFIIEYVLEKEVKNR